MPEEYQVSGREVKKLVKLSRKKKITFAYNAGKGAEDSYLALHRRKSPEVLWKIAKKDGPTNKAASGMMSMEGRLLSVFCTNEIPGLAKKLKRFLKAQKCSVNIQVLDSSGRVLDSDVTELEPDPDMEEAEEDAAEAPEVEAAPEADAAPEAEAAPEAAPEAETEAQAAPAAAPQKADAKADDPKKEELTSAFKDIFPAIKDRIASAEPGIAKKLKTAAQTFGTEVKADRLDRAEKILDVLKKQAAAVTAPAPQPAQNADVETMVEDVAEAETTAPAETGAPARDPERVAKRRNRLKEMRASLQKLMSKINTAR